jgi:hypothetical protein
LDENTKKKMIQQIRNRVSAQQSRDKKKHHLQQLEFEVKKLSKENQLLSQKNIEMNNKLKSFEISYAQLAHENQALKSHLDVCQHCGHSLLSSPSAEYPSTDDHSSDVSASNLTRGSSPFRGSFFNYAMTFATILSVVIMVLLGDGIGGSFDRKKILIFN